MNPLLKSAVRLLTVLPLLVLPAAHAHAQDAYPSKPIRFVIGFAAGGGTDSVLRAIAGQLGPRLGVNVIVENKPGANGNLAGEAVAKAPADGYTLLYNTSSMVLSPHIYAKLTYDYTRELTPVALTANIPLLLATHPSTPVTTVQELVGWLKANPGKANYASAGTGNVTHLSTVQFLQTVGAQANHVPYKAEAPALTDLVGGQVDFYLGTANALIPLVNQKRVRGLAISSMARMDAIPDIPTFAETVLPGTGFGAWSGVMAPMGTPPAIIARLNAELNAVLKEPELRAKIIGTGAEVRGSTVEQYATFIAAEHERWGRAVKAVGLKPE